jgi:Fe-S oxidoreductase
LNRWRPRKENQPELFAGTFSEDILAVHHRGACTAQCPAFINPVDEIVDMRRYQALTTGKVPKSVADAHGILNARATLGESWLRTASPRMMVWNHA